MYPDPYLDLLKAWVSLRLFPRELAQLVSGKEGLGC